MEQKKNVHEGHRVRIKEKFFANPNALAEHELLEILLFPLIPRKNTNDIAHRLLNCFGTLEKIFSATPEELAIVEGVGKSIAVELSAIGKIYSAVYDKYKYHEDVRWTSFGKDRYRYIEYFDGRMQETLLVIMLDKRGREITRVAFCDNLKDQVTASIPDVTKAIIMNQPHSIILAHNHPSGFAEPSLQDDKATIKIAAACLIAGVEFNDHVIVAGRNAFSYKHSGERLEYLREKFNVKTLFSQIDDYKE